MKNNSTGFLEKSNFFIRIRVVLIHELTRKILHIKNKILRKIGKEKFTIKQRYSEFQAKKVVFNSDLVLNTSNRISWFYTAFERKDQDPLTNFILGKLDAEYNQRKSILVTGCGTGIMVFHLAEKFDRVDGVDLLDKCISIANKLKYKYQYKNTNFYLDDCFKPSKITRSYDIITVLHWIWTAWMGNYGNKKILDPFSQNTRENLLREFILTYDKKLNSKGILILELIDSIADYRLPQDSKHGNDAKNVYPVRHNLSDVKRITKSIGFKILECHSCFSYGHQPRMVYLLQKEN